MLYDILKVSHILFASLIVITIAYDISLWIKKDPNSIERISHHTTRLIIPLTIIQLFTGFTMISLKQYDFHEKWILVSSIGFPIFVASWLGFVYFSTYSFRRIPSFMLGFTLLCLSFMIFFMTNKIA